MSEIGPARVVEFLEGIEDLIGDDSVLARLSPRYHGGVRRIGDARIDRTRAVAPRAARYHRAHRRNEKAMRVGMHVTLRHQAIHGEDHHVLDPAGRCSLRAGDRRAGRWRMTTREQKQKHQRRRESHLRRMPTVRGRCQRIALTLRFRGGVRERVTSAPQLPARRSMCPRMGSCRPGWRARSER